MKTVEEMHDGGEGTGLQRAVVMFPMIFFQCYLLFTVLLFEFGPIEWPVENPARFYLFVFAVQVFLGVGYFTGINARPNTAHSPQLLQRILTASIIVGVLWSVPTMMIRTATIRDSFGGLLNCIILGILNPGEVYNQHHVIVALRQSGELGALVPYPILILDYLLSPIVTLAFPLSIILWNRMGILLKLGFMFMVTAYVASWVAIGTNKGLFDIVMTVPWAIVAYRLRRGDEFWPALQRLAIAAGTLTLIVMVYFSVASTSRRVERGVDPGSVFGAINPRSPVLLLPDAAARAAIQLTGYITQGYYALDHALEMPFVPCWGVGNSYFLAGVSGPIFGRGVMLERSYPARMEEGTGINVLTRWHTFYVWMASDVTFLGVILLMGLIGRLFAMVWIDVIYGSNAFAVALLPLLALMMFYLPANNQILGFANTAIPFLAALPLWIFTRLRARRIAVSGLSA